MLFDDRENPSAVQELETAVKSLQKSAFQEIKVNLDGYDRPSKITQKETQQDFTPDITASRDGDKIMFELALRSDDKMELAKKWQLLTRISRMKDQGFAVLVPKGNLSFTTEMLKDPQIDADIIRL